MCLSRLGVAGRLITKLGNDEIGRQILETLRRERAIDTSRVSISPVPPTSALSGNHSMAN